LPAHSAAAPCAGATPRDSSPSASSHRPSPPAAGEDDILQHLDRFDEREDADAHREKAREEVPTFAEVG
jgi:hypothetical protein